MISITLPDGNIKAFEPAVSGRDVALSISEGLARNSVAMDLDGRPGGLGHPDPAGRAGPDRHHSGRGSARDHAPQCGPRHGPGHPAPLPEAKLTIGPVVEDGFYYDIDMPPVSEEDFPRIEAEIQKIVKARLPIRRREVTKARRWRFTVRSPTSSR